MSKGSAVPTYPAERIAAARAAFEQHGDAMQAAAETLPRLVRLADGRKLRAASPMSGGLGYLGEDGLTVVASYDATPHGLLLHVSTSYRDRMPSWADLALIRAAFFPADKDVIQVLPKQGEYVNIHQHCLHLFEAPADWQGGWNG